MTILIKNILNILKILVDNTSPRQITWSLILGLGIGISPTFSLQFIFLFLLLLIFNVQFSLAISSAFFFKLLFIPLAGIFHILGDFVLRIKSLNPIFSTLINTPLVPYTNFNNTIVMGSLIFFLLSLPIQYFFFLTLIKKYQDKVVSRIKKSKAYLFIKASFLVKWYEKYDRLYK
jgi:uncharacterized protein (TIGR03546 family)